MPCLFLRAVFMKPIPNSAHLDKLRGRVRALRAKTIDNGCTEDEALAAAAKVAELLDRHDLSLSDVELRDSQCERGVYETYRKKRIPIVGCIGAVAHFCDCKVWREKNPDGDTIYVFFGLPGDVEVALYLTALIDNAVTAPNWAATRPAAIICASGTRSVTSPMRRSLSEWWGPSPKNCRR